VSQLVDLDGDEAVLVAQSGDDPYSGKLAISAYYKDLIHHHLGAVPRSAGETVVAQN
jgi:hypothetical protein